MLHGAAALNARGTYRAHDARTCSCDCLCLCICLCLAASPTPLVQRREGGWLNRASFDAAVLVVA
jgi:hypothetical protein